MRVANTPHGELGWGFTMPVATLCLFQQGWGWSKVWPASVLGRKGPLKTSIWPYIGVAVSSQGLASFSCHLTLRF